MGHKDNGQENPTMYPPNDPAPDGGNPAESAAPAPQQPIKVSEVIATFRKELHQQNLINLQKDAMIEKMMQQKDEMLAQKDEVIRQLSEAIRHITTTSAPSSDPAASEYFDELNRICTDAAKTAHMNSTDIRQMSAELREIQAKMNAQATPPDPLQSDMTAIREHMTELSESAKKTAVEMRELHRLYHNEFALRLKSMQDELDAYHKISRGEVFDSVLSAIARIYVNYETLADEVTDPKLKKNISYLLDDLLDMLSEHGVTRIKSFPGDRRNTRHCQVRNRLETDDPAKHDTIAASLSAGFCKENRSIIKEVIDVYLYDRSRAVPATPDKPADPEPTPPLPEDAPIPADIADIAAIDGVADPAAMAEADVTDAIVSDAEMDEHLDVTPADDDPDTVRL